MSTKLINKSSIKQLLAEMSVEDKCLLITGGGPVMTSALEKYGIPSAMFLDGGTGMNFVQLMQVFTAERSKEKGLWPELADCTTGLECLQYVMPILIGFYNPSMLTEEQKEILAEVQQRINTVKPGGAEPGCFPPGILLAATWNKVVVRENGKAVGAEASAYGLDILLGTPNVNIYRDPRGGRGFEGYGEDPCLTASLAPAFVQGVQGEGVLANVKHFAANNQETQRMGIDEKISARALEEIYFPGFKACVQEGGVRSLMAAYNKINGVHCAENASLLKTTLRDKWGYTGLVMSDWGAVSDQAAAVKGGCDLAMPGPRTIEPLLSGLEEGRVTLEEIDNCAAHMLQALLEMPVMKGKKHFSVDTELSKKAAYAAAVEGIVLLKNEEVLPLNKDTKVAFIGEKSKKFVESGMGSAQVVTNLSTNLYDCAAEKAGTENVSFGAVCEECGTVVITVSSMGQEGSDRPGIDLDPEEHKMLITTLHHAKDAGKKTIVILNVAGPVHMEDWISLADAVLCVFFPGMEGGRAAADILFGDSNPSGHLPISFPKYLRDCPSFESFPGTFGRVNYSEDIYVGYRYYDLKQKKTLFPFGHGLSYSSFQWGEPVLSSDILDIDKDGSITITLPVTNIGGFAGKELVQLYISALNSRIPKPVKEMKQFCKKEINAGETTEITLMISRKDLASYDEELGTWVTEPGKYSILLGASAEDVRYSLDFTAEGDNPYDHIRVSSTIQDVFAIPEAVEIIREKLGPWLDADPQVMIGTELVFFPDTKFSEIWEKGFARRLTGCTKEEISRIYKELSEELEKL